MRSKVETIMTDEKKVKKVGMKDIQMEGFDYEMTVSINLDREKHQASVDKHPIGLFENEYPFVVSEEHGKAIREWSESGAVEKPTEDQTATFQDQLITLGMTQEKWEEATELKWNELTIEVAGQWIKKNAFAIEERKKKAEEAAKVEERNQEDSISGEKIFDPDKVLKELEAKKNAGKRPATEAEKRFMSELDKSLEVTV
jgi:hypothetical protein